MNMDEKQIEEIRQRLEAKQADMGAFASAAMNQILAEIENMWGGRVHAAVMLIPTFEIEPGYLRPAGFIIAESMNNPDNVAELADMVQEYARRFHEVNRTRHTPSNEMN